MRRKAPMICGPHLPKITTYLRFPGLVAHTQMMAINGTQSNYGTGKAKPSE
ncbi:hypothetical protein MES4922_370048 [Mesorhizobium ventifaucium]|uniref:Uncharacterized protein n=1 Tax=Mesorhizobium ventifaucium TaxID=666020 RepID=A0ABN8K3F9_9HYPH|nr:hypothetical protein MES4922_370048 [Mesorhizobium ventifaucium]